MKLRLISNWKTVLFSSISAWASYLGVAILIIPEILYGGFGIEVDPVVAWTAALITILVGNILGRILDQDGLSKRDYWPVIIGTILILLVLLVPVAGRAETQKQNGPPTLAHTLSFAVPLIAKWEGLELRAYKDIVGVPTVCYGETKGVKMGDSYTLQECNAMLTRRVTEFRYDLWPYWTKETLGSRMTARREASYVSLAYNVGVSGAGRSTAVRRLNNGDILGGCKAQTWWNKAGKRVIRGLVNRRAEEYCYCTFGTPKQCKA